MLLLSLITTSEYTPTFNWLLYSPLDTCNSLRGHALVQSALIDVCRGVCLGDGNSFPWPIPTFISRAQCIEPFEIKVEMGFYSHTMNIIIRIDLHAHYELTSTTQCRDCLCTSGSLGSGSSPP